MKGTDILGLGGAALGGFILSKVIDKGGGEPGWAKNARLRTDVFKSGDRLLTWEYVGLGGLESQLAAGYVLWDKVRQGFYGKGDLDGYVEIYQQDGRAFFMDIQGPSLSAAFDGEPFDTYSGAYAHSKQLTG